MSLNIQSIQLKEGFSLIQTADGSPSLIHCIAQDLEEMMHHSAGALTESVYIYTDALKLHLSQCEGLPALNIMSVGLGLAYNEILSTALAIKLNTAPLKIVSFESVDWLVKNWIHWLQDQPSDLHECYQDICFRTAQVMGVDKDQLIATLRDHYQKGLLQTAGPLMAHKFPQQKFDVIYYDMYSTKMNEEFWSEEYLTELLRVVATKDLCTVSTYAATGKLNRALKSNGFKIFDRPGFAGKRQSTLASRPCQS